MLLLMGCAAPYVQLCAQEDNEIGRLRRDLQRLSQRVDEGTRRESELHGRVHQLEGDLQRQKLESARQVAVIDEFGGLAPLESQINDLRGTIEHRFSPINEDNAVEIGGYFDFEFRDDEARSNSSFDQHRLILQLNANIYRRAITFRMELEIEGGGADASFLSDNEIVLEFGELHFHIADEVNLKVGALLVPFGRFNRLHDSPLRDLTDRPLVNRRITPTTWTDAGIAIYGTFELATAVTFDYDVALINGLDDGFSSTTGGGFRASRNSFRRDNNDNKMIVGRLGITPELGFLDYANVGISFGFGKYDSDDRRNITLWGLDWTLKKGAFEFIGEYAQFNLDRGVDEIGSGVPGGADGFYAQINFHFFPQSWIGATDFFTSESTFTLVFRYGTIDTDDSATAIDRNLRADGYRDDLIRYTIGINFRPIEKTVIKLEYQFFDEKSGVDDADNNRFVISFASFF